MIEFSHFQRHLSSNYGERARANERTNVNKTSDVVIREQWKNVRRHFKLIKPNRWSTVVWKVLKYFFFVFIERKMCITCQSVICLAEVIDITFGHGCVHINTSKNGWSIGKSILHHIFSQCNCILYIIKHIASVPKTSSFHLIVFVLDFHSSHFHFTHGFN